MGISVERLWSFARNIEVCYKPRRMQFENGKHRPIDPLYNPPKRLLKKLHDFLQRAGLHHPRAHGAVRKRSCFSSARIHVGQRYVWIRDASNCYPSITPKALYRELRALKFSRCTAKLLTRLFTYRGSVPQGSPVSGDALNLFFWRIDQLLASMAGNCRVGYSRVADDFVFSSKFSGAADKMLATLENALRERGIAINAKKKAQHGLQTCSVDRRVHSISVSKPRGTAINRDQAAEALLLATNYVRACKSLSADSIEAVAAKRRTLCGWMHYCRQAEFGPAKAIRQHLEAGDRHVLKRLRSLSISPQKNKWWFVNRKQKRNEPRRLAMVWQRRTAESTSGYEVPGATGSASAMCSTQRSSVTAGKP
jgi:hypothetical protein